ncbi:LLM class flavin-dependent oxidoreductase [Mucilaginibacter sp. 10B2]|nr:LLM class flavin-dependent oxidoreductase [Mucilaginibacter sp. 10B2]
MRLSSSVTVLSSADLVCGGRAEMIAGCGSFVESFPLFGYDLNDYDELFEEKLDQLMQINKTVNLTWKGKFRAPISDQGIYPRTLQEQLPIWIALAAHQNRPYARVGWAYH